MFKHHPDSVPDLTLTDDNDVLLVHRLLRWVALTHPETVLRLGADTHPPRGGFDAEDSLQELLDTEFPPATDDACPTDVLTADELAVLNKRRFPGRS